MNLNGEKSKQNTILNGRALYKYDQKKIYHSVRHAKKHQKEIQKWRGESETKSQKSSFSLYDIFSLMFVAGIIFVFAVLMFVIPQMISS